MVDHEKLTRDFIVNVMMYSVNRDILAFEDGEAVKAYIQAGGTIDLLLSEVQLPAYSGFELLKYVKEERPHIKFIITSADPADETAAAELGADAFLAKPFALQDLFEIVKQFVVEE